MTGFSPLYGRSEQGSSDRQLGAELLAACLAWDDERTDGPSRRGRRDDRTGHR